MARITGDRNRRLFDGARAYKKATEVHARLAEEIDSYHFQRAPCIFAKSYRALVRTVGYFKYNSAPPLFLRGQTKCYGIMEASLHRRAPPVSDADVDAFLNRYRAALGLANDPQFVLSTEPLLQHYGVETRWLDVVDSVPHALFFATHQMVKSAHPDRWTYIPSTEEYGFLYLLDVGAMAPVRRKKKQVVGFWRGSSGFEIADLRKLQPSIALRPHAQHGLLVRDTTGTVDVWERLVARIAVPAAEARRWILGNAFERSELFPPRAWDGVYGHLLSPKMGKFLSAEGASGKNWGSITRFDFHGE